MRLLFSGSDWRGDDTRTKHVAKSLGAWAHYPDDVCAHGGVCQPAIYYNIRYGIRKEQEMGWFY